MGLMPIMEFAALMTDGGDKLGDKPSALRTALTLTRKVVGMLCVRSTQVLGTLCIDVGPYGHSATVWTVQRYRSCASPLIMPVSIIYAYRPPRLYTYTV